MTASFTHRRSSPRRKDEDSKADNNNGQKRCGSSKVEGEKNFQDHQPECPSSTRMVHKTLCRLVHHPGRQRCKRIPDSRRVNGGRRVWQSAVELSLQSSLDGLSRATQERKSGAYAKNKTDLLNANAVVQLAMNRYYVENDHIQGMESQRSCTSYTANSTQLSSCTGGVCTGLVSICRCISG